MGVGGGRGTVLVSQRLRGSSYATMHKHLRVETFETAPTILQGPTPRVFAVFASVISKHRLRTAGLQIKMKNGTAQVKLLLVIETMKDGIEIGVMDEKEPLIISGDDRTGPARHMRR